MTAAKGLFFAANGVLFLRKKFDHNTQYRLVMAVIAMWKRDFQTVKKLQI